MHGTIVYIVLVYSQVYLTFKQKYMFYYNTM